MTYVPKVRVVHESDRMDILPNEWQIIVTYEDGTELVSFAKFYEIGQTLIDMSDPDKAIQSIEIT